MEGRDAPAVMSVKTAILSSGFTGSGDAGEAGNSAEAWEQRIQRETLLVCHACIRGLYVVVLCGLVDFFRDWAKLHR